MKTKELYYETPQILAFDASVLAVKEKKNQWWVQLDQTAFYPNAGGMACDVGHLNDVFVVAVERVDDVIWHVCTSAPKDAVVRGVVDASVRLRNVQNHDAQHLLSGILARDYQFATVSHHVYNGFCDLVLEGQTLNTEIFDKVERFANELIRANFKIDIDFVPKSELPRLNISDHPKYTDPVRIVNIEGLNDNNACGCLHLKTLGEIQGIKILGVETTRQQTRLFFTAGGAMLDLIGKYHHVISKIKGISKGNLETLVDKVQELADKTLSLSKELTQTKHDYYRLLIPSKACNERFILNLENVDYQDLKIAAYEVVASQSPLIAFLQLKKGDHYQFILAKNAKNEIALEQILEKLKENHRIKGGGRGLTINGQSQECLIESIKTLM